MYFYYRLFIMEEESEITFDLGIEFVFDDEENSNEGILHILCTFY